MTSLNALQIGLGALGLALFGTMLFVSRIARHVPFTVGGDLFNGLDLMGIGGAVIGGAGAVRWIFINDVTDPVALALGAVAVAVFLVVLLIFCVRVASLARAVGVSPGIHAVRAIGGIILLAGLFVLFEWLG